MVCSTIEMMPAAMSSFAASLCALASMLAVASIGRLGNGSADMSPMSRCTFFVLPCMASADTALMSLVFSNNRDRPASVPPPTPIPPMWRISSPSHSTKLVPVPIDTTMVWSSFDS